MPTVLVTGANRGLGLGFVKHYASAGWSVIAGCRRPDESDELHGVAKSCAPRVAVERIDVLDHGTIDEAADKYADQPIDVLINNAGIIGPIPIMEHIERQHFGTMDYDVWEEVMRTNTFGPLKMAEAFVDNIAASGHKKLVNLSSTLGSIAEDHLPAIAYASSKTALNKVMTLLADKLRARGIIVALFCPGHVKTRMGPNAPIEIEDSIKGLTALIGDLTPERTGTFTRFNGEAIAW